MIRCTHRVTPGPSAVTDVEHARTATELRVLHTTRIRPDGVIAHFQSTISEDYGHHRLVASDHIVMTLTGCGGSGLTLQTTWLR